MPWRTLDPWFFLLAWSSWIGITYVDFNSPDNSLPGLFTALYPFFLSAVFLIPLGWYWYEDHNKNWQKKDYWLYLIPWALLTGFYIVATLFEQSLAGLWSVLSVVWIILFGAGLIGVIPAHILCITRWKKAKQDQINRTAKN